MTDSTYISYKSAGVDINASNSLIKNIKHITKKTNRSEVMSELGGFGALCTVPKKYKEPLLVSSTDGVGTKLRLIMDFKRHDSIGIDLVAMCVNDLLVHGAEPLFFLDYYATSKLNVDIATAVVSGIANGCIQSGCSLVGGETAEMPGFYHDNDYDLAGFCVGVVEKSKLIDGSKVQDGDTLIALASSGLHANGYSLVRKILELNHINPNVHYLNDISLIDHLLTPTRIYVKSILHLIQQIEVHTIIHLTGGGFWGNIPRMLPENTQAVLQEKSWKWPLIFDWIQQKGSLSRYVMYNTFNCGVGMIIALSPKNADKAIELLKSTGEKAWKIGSIVMNSNAIRQVVINP